MFYHKLSPSSGPAVAVESFYNDYVRWVLGCVQQHHPFEPSNAPKQTALVRAWVYFLKTQQGQNAAPAVFAFVHAMRDKIPLHLEVAGLWQRGYWAFANVVDGSYYFEHFLKQLWEVEPTDATTRELYLAAAQYLGNWDARVPAWFNWETGLFYSYFMGTESVSDDAQFQVNVVEHFRLLGMALTAFHMSGQARYLELAQQYGMRWAQAILAETALPVGLSEEGPLYTFNGPVLEAYNHLVGETTTLHDELDRAENFLIHDAIRILLDLWQLTQDNTFHAAATKILDILSSEISDPDAGAVVAAIRTYRNKAKSDRYDALVLQQVEGAIPYEFATIAMEPLVERDVRPYGVGKDRFLPVWFEDNCARRYSPLLLGLAAEISGNEAMATFALDLGRSYFAVARMAFEHDEFDRYLHAQSMGSLAAGHRRDNGAGLITALLEPLGSVVVSNGKMDWAVI